MNGVRTTPRIAAGIVYHRRGLPVRRSSRIHWLACVNADEAGKTPWRGFGANHNRLMDEAAGYDWYVAVNPDLRCDEDDLVRLVAAAEKHGYSVAAPLLRSPWGQVGGTRALIPSPRSWLIETVRGGSRGRGHHRHSDSAVGASWVSGACIAINLSAGLRFDERYFMYFEDVDICLRAHASGQSVGVCTQLVLDHASGWRAGDPLLRARGVEFARSAMTFAEAYGYSRAVMRVAGVLRFGSRVPFGRSSSENAAVGAIAKGFLAAARTRGLAELASDYNETLR